MATSGALLESSTLQPSSSTWSSGRPLLYCGVRFVLYPALLLHLAALLQGLLCSHTAHSAACPTLCQTADVLMLVPSRDAVARARGGSGPQWTHLPISPSCNADMKRPAGIISEEALAEKEAAVSGEGLSPHASRVSLSARSVPGSEHASQRSLAVCRKSVELVADRDGAEHLEPCKVGLALEHLSYLLF